MIWNIITIVSALIILGSFADILRSGFRIRRAEKQMELAARRLCGKPCKST